MKTLTLTLAFLLSATYPLSSAEIRKEKATLTPKPAELGKVISTVTTYQASGTGLVVNCAARCDDGDLHFWTCAKDPNDLTTLCVLECPPQVPVSVESCGHE